MRRSNPTVAADRAAPPAPFAAGRVALLALFAAGLCLSCRGEKSAATDAPRAAAQQSPGPALPRTPLRGNLLLNPGFEEGPDPWFALETEAWVDFQLCDTLGHGGRRSALLAVRAHERSPRAQIWGVSQYANPAEFPRKLSGWFRVDGWKRGATNQYVQAVLMVWGRLPERPFPNYTIRYPLGGVDQQPMYMSNGRYRFLRTELPPPGEWTYFETDPAADFRESWLLVPSTYEKLQVFFEARFDDRTDLYAPTEADVYFDDVYLGE